MDYKVDKAEVKIAQSEALAKLSKTKPTILIGAGGTAGHVNPALAIARAFLRNPKILMLDEATASLDSESESMVQRALDSLMKGRTTLVIAHRLSTIVDADKIYFIEKGQITGSGKHNELVATHPLYAKYVSEQLTVGQ